MVAQPARARRYCPRRRARVFFGGGIPPHMETENSVEPKAGSAAPDFTLASHTDQKVSLASFKGRPVVVAFMPFAFTGG